MASHPHSDEAARSPADEHGPGGDMLLPSEIEAARRRNTAPRRAGRAASQAVVRRLDDLFGAGGPAFRTLANAHASSTAGDTLIALALANSLFFAVPSAEARGNVVLYLLITVAPFAVIGPLLGWVLDRQGSGRMTIVGSAALRVVAAAALIFAAEGFWLFPLAFVLLVLSRVHGISRSALLPQVLSNALALVTANAKLAQVGVIAGAAIVPVGALLARIGPEPVLGVAAIVFAISTQQSMKLPRFEDAAVTVDDLPEVDDETEGDSGGPLVITPLEDPWHGIGDPYALTQPLARPPSGLESRHPPKTDEPPPARLGPGVTSTPLPDYEPRRPRGREDAAPTEPAEAETTQAAPRAEAAPRSEPIVDPEERRLLSPTQLRLTRFATAVVRLLNGFLVLLLAFAFRDVDAPLADFGAVLAAAGLGYGLASVAAPRLERTLREEPMVVAALAVEAAAAFVAGQWFGLWAAALLSLAAGYAWGTAKFAFDGLLQANVAPAARGRAFTRSETMFQMAWVLGALAPTGITFNVQVGLALAGVAALIAQTIYVSRLLSRI